MLRSQPRAGLDLGACCPHDATFLAGVGPRGTPLDPTPGMLPVGKLAESTSFSSNTAENHEKGISGQQR